jgi:Xaa-Pro dipeptidase
MKNLQAMRQAASHVDHILLEEVPGWIQEGITEQEIFDRLCSAVQARGRYGLSFDPIVAFGAGGAEPHHEPTETALTPGDTILIDCGAICDGWCSDCTRMFSFGEPSARFLQKYRLLLSAHETVLPQFIAGAKCSELDGTVRNIMGEDAAFFIHTLGHGVGSEVHMSPRIGPQSQEVLTKGESVTCEPGLYFPDEFGIRIEDQLIIRAGDFPEILTKTPREIGVIDGWGSITYLR